MTSGLTANPLVIAEPTPELAGRYLGDHESSVYLIRPDQHVVARWPEFDAAKIASAMNVAIGKV